MITLTRRCTLQCSQAAFRELDKNMDGKITLDEFIALVSHIETTEPKESKWVHLWPHLGYTFDLTWSSPLSLCVHSISYFPFQFWWGEKKKKPKKTLSCAKWKLKGFGHRSFSVQTPLVWNSLPSHIRHSCSLSLFKTSSKTFLFTSAFSKLPWFPRRFEIPIPPPPIDCWCLCVVVCFWFVSESESDW